MTQNTMKTINGVYTLAKIFTTNNENTAIDDYTIAQLQMLCDNETSKDCIIRVMPDVHPGKVGTIGLTMTIGQKVMPNLSAEILSEFIKGYLLRNKCDIII